MKSKAHKSDGEPSTPLSAAVLGQFMLLMGPLHPDPARGTVL